MFYLCGENKGADHLRSYDHTADNLCFVFRICKMKVFSFIEIDGTLQKLLNLYGKQKVIKLICRTIKFIANLIKLRPF